MENVELINLIADLNKKVEKIMEQVVKKVDLTKIQALVLISINNKENNINCSVNDIVNELELNQGNTSSLLKRMENLGLIEKVRAKDDERRVELVITRKGKEKLNKIQENMNELKQKIDDEYNEQRKKALINGMQQMNDLFDFMIEEEK